MEESPCRCRCSSPLPGLLLLGVVLLAGAFFIPWQNVKWGKLELKPAQTVTVSGSAESQERNQIASFTAGVSAVYDDKQTAIDEVNGKTKTIIDAVKDFGIAEDDIQTQSLSVNQGEQSYYEEGTYKTRPGQWRVNNSIEITLREIEKASALANLLTNSGATNVYGPNLRTDDTKTAENSLLEKAIENARQKAVIIAAAAGKSVGEVVSVNEGYSSQPLYRVFEAGGGGGAPIEPGTSTVSKTVTVVFELY